MERLEDIWYTTPGKIGIVGTAAAGLGSAGYWLLQYSRLVNIKKGGLIWIMNYLLTGSKDSILKITEEFPTKYVGLGDVRKEVYNVLNSASRGSPGYTEIGGGLFPDVPPNPGITSRYRAILWCLSRVNSLAAEQKTRMIRGRKSIFDDIPTNFLGDRWYYKITPKGGEGGF